MSSQTITQNDLKNILNEVLTGIAANYVIEEGESNSFAYRKWKNGTYEAWTSYTATSLTLTSSSAGTYYGGSATTLNLPSFSTYVGYISYAVTSPTSSGVYIYRVYPNAAGTQLSVEYRAHASTSGGTCGTSIYVRGNWI